MIAPAWVVDDAWRELHPPAEILKLGELPRSPEKLLAATRVLAVLSALRYQPDATGTKCNIYMSDACQILHAPLPHVSDLGDGRGRRELVANDYAAGLRDLKFPGWSKVGTIASSKAVIDLAARGQPVVAVWKNPSPRRDSAGRVLTINGKISYHAGHVVIVVPTPLGKQGIYVTGAGAHCIQECPIEWAFAHYLPQVEFFSHE